MSEQAHHELTSEIIELGYQTAIEAGRLASEAALPYWPNPGNPHFNPGQSLDATRKEGFGNFVTRADTDAEKVIIDTFRQVPELAGLPVRGEESESQPHAEGSPWLNLDSIDGTLNFKHGDTDWGISIALHDGDNTPVVGVITQPSKGRIIAARKGHGAEIRALDGSLIADLSHPTIRRDVLPADNDLLIGYDFGYKDRQQQIARHAGTMLGVNGKCLWSSADANVRIAEGVLDGYYAESQTVHDIGATKALLDATGGVMTDMNGSPVDWSDAPTRSILSARTPQIHARLLQLLHS